MKYIQHIFFYSSFVFQEIPQFSSKNFFTAAIHTGFEREDILIQ